MNKYVLKDGVEIKEIQQKMYSNGDGFAYQDERSAEYASANGRICECGQTTSAKWKIWCDDCATKKQEERFNSLEIIEWDRETPLCIFETDHYFFDEDDIDMFIEDEAEGTEKKEDLQLVVCVSYSVPCFDFNEFLNDVFPEDMNIGDYSNKKTKYSAEELEQMVNDYIEDISPISWFPGKKRIQL
jgi:hypothetical protein